MTFWDKLAIVLKQVAIFYHNVWQDREATWEGKQKSNLQKVCDDADKYL